MNKYEVILNTKASEIMKEWDILKFRKSNPTLFKVIMESMIEVDKQEMFNMSIEDWE